MIVAIVDTETNGRTPGEVIELAMLLRRLSSKVYVPFWAGGMWDPSLEATSRRFTPDQPSTFKALSVHGLSSALLEGYDPSAIAGGCVEEVECFIAHNARFDIEVLKVEPPLVIDTLALSRAFCPDDEGHTLGAMLLRVDERLGLEHRNVAHGALADVQACARVLDWLVAEFVAPPSRTWASLACLSEALAAPQTIPFGKHKGTTWSDLDFGYMRWYLNQADQDPQIRDRMLREMAYRNGSMARCPHCDGLQAIVDDESGLWSLCSCFSTKA